MTSCCPFCCFYPNYKRKVDSIYPRNLDGNLVKNEIDKLQYYSCQHPEKLSKIGDYLYQNLKWGLNGSYKNKNYVRNTMEAVDKILIIISPEYLNFYANSYLKMIQKLLEQNDLDHQKLATTSFKKFCEKEQYNQTSNYNRNYDSFVCQFSAMCYNNHKDSNIRSEIRISGLQGIGAMVKKLQADESSLQATYLWDNMDKIVSALLFIMQENFTEFSKSVENNNKTIIKSPSVAQQAVFITSSIISGAGVGSTSQLTQPEGDLFSKIGAINDDVTVNANNESSTIAAVSNSTAAITTDKIQINLDQDTSINNENVNAFEMKLFKSSTVNTDGNLSGSSPSSPSSPPPLYEKNSDDSSVNAQTSLLHQQSKQQDSNQARSLLDSGYEARALLKEISTKADYTTITRIVRPLLIYMDNNDAWKQVDFIQCVFETVMNNIKQQHAIVIKELIKHLDSHRNSEASMKRHIIKAISKCIEISALHSVGTTAQIIDIFTNLLKHLNFSLEKLNNTLAQTTNVDVVNSINGSGATGGSVNLNKDEEVRFQNEILNAMKNFTSQLPDYAKNDVITFIARQINSHQYTYTDIQKDAHQQDKRNLNIQLNEQMRNKYLDALFEICTKYRPTQVFGAFTSVPFLEDILRLTIIYDSQSRKKSNEILHYLLDKYDLLSKIKKYQKNFIQTANRQSVASVSGESKLTSTNVNNLSLLDILDYNLKPSKEDIHFMRKHGRLFLSHINESLFIKTNLLQNYEYIFITIALFLIGSNDKEFLIDLVAFGLHIQYLTFINYTELTFKLKCDINAFLTAYFDLITKLNTTLPMLNQYLNKILIIRKTPHYSKYLYPNYVYPTATTSTIPADFNALKQTLSLSAKSLNQLNTETANDSEFNAEFDDISQEFINLNRKKQEDKEKEQQNESDEDNNNGDNEKSSEKTVEAVVMNNNDDLKILKKYWVFDKQAIIDVLTKSGISMQRLNSFNTEFSLAVIYLQQKKVPTTNTCLKYRSINNMGLNVLNNDATLSDSQSYLPTQQGQLNGTSQRYSLQKSNSFTEDGVHHHMNGYDSFETSYDSASQVSEMDYADYLNNANQSSVLNTSQKLMASIKKKFFIGNSNDNIIDTNNNATATHQHQQQQLNLVQTLMKQATQQQQPSSKQMTNDEIIPFDTIKRYLLNNNNLPTSPSYIINNYSTLSSSSKSQSTINRNNNNTLAIGNDNELTYTNTYGNGNSININDEDEKVKIIDEFKQKTFDEIKQDLNKIRVNHNDKYKQVLEFINKELYVSKDNQKMLKDRAVEQLVSSKTHLQHQASSQQLQQQQQASGKKQLVPLNDIEFPRLFMY